MKKTNKSRLTPAQIKEFKDMLLTKRKEILGSVSFMENETLRRPNSELSNMPFHMADIGTDNYEQDLTLELMDSERKVLTEIELALLRIEDGSYGICEGTDKPIERGRLEAIPWTRYCVTYAGQIEKGLAGKENSPDQADYGDDGEES